MLAGNLWTTEDEQKYRILRISQRIRIFPLELIQRNLHFLFSDFVALLSPTLVSHISSPYTHTHTQLPLSI